MARPRSAGPEETVRDAEDARLLAAGEYAALLAAYYPIILQRLRVRRLPLDEAEEVRQRVVEHLLGELDAGKRYDVPFRVVVHQRTSWKLLDYFAERKRHPGPLPEEQASDADDVFERVESDVDFQRRIAGLAPRERQVVELRWRRGLEVPQIAGLLGIEANAVHQALHRAHRKLRRGFA